MRCNIFEEVLFRLSSDSDGKAVLIWKRVGSSLSSRSTAQHWRMASWTRQPSHIEWDSPFLQHVNESYRTWRIKSLKVKHLLCALESFALPDGKHTSSKGKEHVTKLSTLISQLTAMTVGQDDPECSNDQISRIAEMVDYLERLPEKRTNVDENEANLQERTRRVDANSSGHHRAFITSSQQTDAFLLNYQQALCKLEDWQEEMFNEKYTGEADLKVLEAQVLADWQDKRQEFECWTRRYEMLQGLKLAMRAALARYDLRAKLLEDHTKVEETKIAAWDVLAQDMEDPQDREATLKREHVGSRGHPNGCWPCHFQSRSCWKASSCSFCHICPKPKRKSKHQRTVEKRREEHDQQVRDNLGIACLDELAKIDAGRRQVMNISEQLKRRVKDAYASGRKSEIDSATHSLHLMQHILEKHKPALLNANRFQKEIQTESEPSLDEQTKSLSTSSVDEEEMPTATSILSDAFF